MSKTKAETPPARYVALVGLSYPPGKRAEPGAIVADLPPESVPWLLEQGYIKAEAEVEAKAEKGGAK